MPNITLNELRVGNVIEHKNALWRVVSTEHVKPGKGGAFIQAELKNIRTGTKLNERFRSEESVNRLNFAVEPATFLYQDGDNFEFLDKVTYEQFSIPLTTIGEKKAFLQENMDLGIEKAEEYIVDIVLPETVILKIVDTTPFINKGQTATATTKAATLENGLKVQVPQFVNNEEKIVLRTSDLKYIKRAE